MEYVIDTAPDVRLRAFRRTDLSPFMAYRNDPEVARFQSWEGISLTDAQAFVHAQEKAQLGHPGCWVQLAIEHRQSGEMLGDCAVRVSEDGRQAEIGFTLARSHQGRGFATQAVASLLDHLFNNLKLHRVIAVTDVQNTGSVKLLERLRMRREAHHVQNIWFKGAWGDEYIYALLAEEWLPSARGNRKPSR